MRCTAKTSKGPRCKNDTVGSSRHCHLHTTTSNKGPSTLTDVDGAVDFVSTMSSRIVTLGLYKARYCQRGVPRAVKARLDRHEKQLIQLLRHAVDHGTNFQQAKQVVGAKLDTLHALIEQHCRGKRGRNSERKKSYSDSYNFNFASAQGGPFGNNVAVAQAGPPAPIYASAPQVAVPPVAVARTSPLLPDIPIGDANFLMRPNLPTIPTYGQVFQRGPETAASPAAPKGFMGRLKYLFKMGNKKTIEDTVRPIIYGNWGIIQRIKSSPTQYHRTHMLLDNWGLLLHVVMICVQHKQEWILATLPPELQYILKVTFTYLLHVTHILMGHEGQIDMIALESKSYFEPVANVATYAWDMVANAATRVKDTTANVVTYPATKIKNTVDEALVKVGEITETATEDYAVQTESFNKNLRAVSKRVVVGVVGAVCLGFLVNHIFVIYMDKKKRSQLPTPPRLIVSKPDKDQQQRDADAKKKHTIKDNVFLGLILGSLTLGATASFAYTIDPKIYVKMFRKKIQEIPEGPATVETIATHMQTAKDTLSGATPPPTPSVGFRDGVTYIPDPPRENQVQVPDTASAPPPPTLRQELEDRTVNQEESCSIQ